MSTYFCSECGNEVTKWSGKCPHCGAWNSLKESSRVIGKKKSKHTIIESPENVKPIQLNNVQITKDGRIKTGITEFDCVLGGGIVPGMVILIGGEPGIGKSTLMLQISNKLAKESKKILYVSGEESTQQILLRSKRLGVKSDNIFLFCTYNLLKILDQIQLIDADLVIIDSIQSVSSEKIDSAPGTISQLRECTLILTQIAKKFNLPIILIGHVTKDGFVAGPKIIEHIVDTVLYFEGDKNHHFKILRTSKNRFGSTNEIGLFEMRKEGLVEVKDTTEMFINEEKNSIGSSIGCIIEGSRPFLIEVQSLVSSASYGNSQRVAIGFDHKRLAVLIAVIEKVLGIELRNYDIFVNIIGGLKVLEPSLDLAIIISIISSFQEKPVLEKTVLIGEVGLNGNIRNVAQMEKRVKEAKKLGYQKICISQNNNLKEKNISLIKTKNIAEVLSFVF